MAQLDWMEKAAADVNADAAFKKLGTAELEVAFRAGKVARVAKFDAFEVTEVRDIDEADLRDVELLVDMSAREWTNYLKRRAKGNGPSIMGLETANSIMHGLNPLAELKFHRYHRSLQAFVDAGARIAYG